MKSLLARTERRLPRLFRQLSNHQNFHLKAEMFSFHSKYFIYRELKRAPQKLSFCFKCPDTGTVLTNSEGQPQMLTFVHILESCNQDSVTVLAIINDVLKQLKTAMPDDVNCLYFRQDHTGCSQSASTLLAIQKVANKYHINVKLDFSDPQGGRG